MVSGVRLPKKLRKTVHEAVRREHLDESTAIRRLVAVGATEYAVRQYREGRVTLGEAAGIAESAAREMIEILVEHGVKGNVGADQERKAIEFVLS